MQPRSDQPPQTKLLKISQNMGNTTQLILNLARTLLRNGQKLFNSNLVLRRYVANDISAANLKTTIAEKVPSLARDLEIVENILNKCRSAAGASANKDKIEQFYARYESLLKEAENYTTQRESLQKQLSNFIKQQPENIQEMIDNMK